MIVLPNPVTVNNREFVEAFWRSHTVKAVEAMALELLDRSITVTNVKERPTPPSNAAHIFYYVNADTEFLPVFKVAVLKCWFDQMWNGVEPGATIAGPKRGWLMFPTYVSLPNIYITQAGRDEVLDLHLNPIRYVPGQGFMIWGDTLWRNGTVYPRSTEPSSFACVQALAPQYGKYL